MIAPVSESAAISRPAAAAWAPDARPLPSAADPESRRAILGAGVNALEPGDAFHVMTDAVLANGSGRAALMPAHSLITAALPLQQQRLAHIRPAPHAPSRELAEMQHA